MKETNTWDATNYNKHAGFVSSMANEVVELLDAKEDETILDLGCGEGTLALEIQSKAKKVIAVDLSSDMVEKTKKKEIEAYVKSATSLDFTYKFDAVFSNAVLHWVKEDEKAIQNINSILKQNGRFVAEFGGYGNIKSLTDAMIEVFDTNKYGVFNNPWNFVKKDYYKELLEKHGFEVEYIESIVRPTPIDDISNWLDIFANGIIEHLNNQNKQNFKDEVRTILKNKIYTKENGWVVDYVRLRLKAIKKKEAQNE